MQKSQGVPNLRALYLLSLSLIVLCLIPFYQVVRFDFFGLDDELYIVNNTVVRSGLSWSGIQWAFTSLHGNNWHPVTSIFMMTEVSLFGVNAAGFHAVNLLLHTVNAVLLFFILLRATKLLSPSFFVACLFAVHPTRAESVAWIVELKDVLSTLFALWAILLYVKYGKASKLSVFGIFILSLMSKQMYVTLPALFLVLDYWPLQRFSREKLTVLILEKIPYFLASLIATKLVVAVHLKIGSLGSLELYPLDLRLKNAIVSFAKYIIKMFALFMPSGFYDPYEKSYPLTLWLPCLLAAMAMTVVVFIIRKKHPCLLSGWLLFCIALAPVIGIIQTSSQAMSDRFTYFSYIGLFIMVFYFLFTYLGKSKIGRRLFAAIGITVSILSALACYIQTSYWRNSQTLFQHAIDVNPKNSLAYFKLGTILYLQEGKKREGIAHVRKALDLEPSSNGGHNALGQMLGSEGDFEGAEAAFKQALTLHSDDIASANNLGTLYLNFGKNELALQYFKRAIAINPNNPSANEIHLNLLRYAHKTCDFQSIEEFLPPILPLKSSLLASKGLVAWYEQLKGNSTTEKEQSCKEDKQREELIELTKLSKTLKEAAQIQKVYKIY